MPTQIVATRLNGDDRLAMVETVSLTLLALAGAAGCFAGDRGRRRSAAAAGRARRPRGSPIRRPRSRRLLAACAGWGLAVLLLLPHLTLLLVSFVPVGTWTTEPLPPAYTLRQLPHAGAGSGAARPLLNSLWLATVATVAAVAIALAGALLSARRASPGRPRHRGVCWRCLGGAGDGLRHRAGDRVQRARAAGPAASCWSAPSGSFRSPISYGICRSPAAPSLAGVRALDPSLDEAAATPRRRALAHPAPGDAAAAPAGAAGGGEPRVRHRVRRFRDLDHALHLRHPADLARDPVEPAPGGRRVAAAYGVVLMLVSARSSRSAPSRGGAG